MATMNISLPDAMKAWVEAQAEGGRYSNSSDHVRDLIRRDQERQDKIAHGSPTRWTAVWEAGRLKRSAPRANPSSACTKTSLRHGLEAEPASGSRPDR